MAEYGGKTVVFNTEDDLNAAIQLYEEETLTHFVVAGMTPSFSQSELEINTIRWHLVGYGEGHVEIPYDKVPFCWIGRKYLVCQFGKKKTFPKEKDSGVGKSRHKRTTSTKKFNCPAKVSIKKVVKFPEFRIEDSESDTAASLKYAKTRSKDRLLAALKEDRDSVQTEVQFYVKFCVIEDHKNHDMGEEAANIEPIDQRVKAKLEELAQTGVTSCTVLHSLVHKYVENELFKDQRLPPRARRRYFPKLKDVQNFMTRWKIKSYNSKQTSDPHVWDEMEDEEEEMVNVEVQDGGVKDQHEEDKGEQIEIEQSDNVLEHVVVHTQEVDSDNASIQNEVPATTFIIHQPMSTSSTQQWVISNSQVLSSDTQGLSNVVQVPNSDAQELGSDVHVHVPNSVNLEMNSSTDTRQLSSNTEQLSSTQESINSEGITNSEVQEQSDGSVAGPAGTTNQVYSSTSEQVYNVVTESGSEQVVIFENVTPESGFEQVVTESGPVEKVTTTSGLKQETTESGSEQLVTESGSEQAVTESGSSEQLLDQHSDEEQATLLTLMKMFNSTIQTATGSRPASSSDPVILVHEPKPKRQVRRIGLVRQMKEVMHEILDYSLLVKDVGVLQRFQMDLEKMRDEASTNACLDPEVVQKELARNRGKRPAELHDLNTTRKRRTLHLSDVL